MALPTYNGPMEITTSQNLKDAFTFLGDTGVFLIELVVKIINSLFPLLIAVALVVFIWGIIRFVLAKGAPQKNGAKQIIFFGVLSITASFTLFGFALFIRNFFGLDGYGNSFFVVAGGG
jgi:hypothetical protein